MILEMKRIFGFLTIILSVFITAQSNIQFETGSFNEILEKAQKENKLIFMDAYAAWCGPCKLMEKNVFTDAQAAEYYNKNFINAHFDMEKGEGRDLAQKYGVYSYPTLLFLNAKGEVVTKNLGYIDAFQFLEFGKKTNEPGNLVSLKERFEKGEADPKFLINVMREYVDSDYPLAKKASERYFKTKIPSEYNKDDVALLLYFIQSEKDPNYKIFQDNKSYIIKIIPEATYNGFNTNIRLQKILAASLDEKNGTIKEDFYLKNAIPIVGKVEAEKMLNQLKVNFYASTQNYPAFEKAALDYYKNIEDFDPNELLRAAWVFSEHIKDPVALKKAQLWAVQSVSRNETVENTYILAKLYSLTGNKDLAKMYAETSVRLAKQYGGDSALSTQLLNELK